jgi:hypothetical protein
MVWCCVEIGICTGASIPIDVTRPGPTTQLEIVQLLASDIEVHARGIDAHDHPQG